MLITFLSVNAILLASTAYTRFAPALMQKSDKIPVPAPTSVTLNYVNVTVVCLIMSPSECLTQN